MSFLLSVLLTLPQLEAIKRRSPIAEPSYRQKLIEKCYKKTRGVTPKQELPSYFETFWWQIFPTTGMRLEEPFWPLTYPFLPHAFPLWEMAPSLGKGIIVSIIDTGVAAFTFIDRGVHYTKHPDLFVAGDFTQECHNLLPYSDRQIDPLRNLVNLIAQYVQPVDKREIENHLPLWIRQYLIDKNTKDLDYYLKKYGQAKLFEKHSTLLTSEGKRLYKSLLTGSSGFCTFRFTNLSAPYNQQNTFADFIPIPDTTSIHIHPQTLPSTFARDHGTHVTSVIGARLSQDPTIFMPFTSQSVTELLAADPGLCGLAPNCTLHMIKALRSGGMTIDIAYLITALERAHQFQSDIVNLSCACGEHFGPNDPLFLPFERTLKKIPYVCGCVGNQGKNKEARITYPARYTDITFSVGSFEWTYNCQTNTYSCPLSSFSRYETRCGPLYVAPGKNIVGCSFLPDSDKPLYALRTGTSHATPIMTGFMTLLLGEFKNEFTDEEILLVCNHSCLRLHTTAEWKERVVYGVIDMRTALCTLHVLQRLKKTLNEKKDFLLLLQTIHSVLFAMVDSYGKEHGITHSFKDGYLDYFNALRYKKASPLVKTAPFRSFKEAVTWIHDNVLAQLAS